MMEPTRREVAALYGTFLFTGIATVLLGPLLPELTQRFALSPGQLAWFFPAQFAGSALGSALAGRSPRAALAAGYFAMAGGLAVLTLGEALLCAAGFFAVGLGVGAVCTATNLRIARGAAERRGARLAAINFVWGGGAALSPLFYSFCEARLGFAGSLLLLAGVLIACLVVLLLAARDPGESAAAATAKSAAMAAPAAPARELWPFVALFFLYVGAENAWGGWLVKLAGNQPGRLDAYLVGSIYWTALLIGRGLAPFSLRFCSEKAWMRVSLAATAAGGVLLQFAASRELLALGAGLTGFGLAAMFPLMVSLLAAATTEKGKREAGWVFSFTGAGGATVPWLVGAGAELAGGNIQLAFLVPLLAMAVFAAILPAAEARAAPW